MMDTLCQATEHVTRSWQKGQAAGESLFLGDTLAFVHPSWDFHAGRHVRGMILVNASEFHPGQNFGWRFCGWFSALWIKTAVTTLFTPSITKARIQHRCLGSMWGCEHMAPRGSHGMEPQSKGNAEETLSFSIVFQNRNSFLSYRSYRLRSA